MPAWISHVPWWAIAAAALVLVVVAISGLRALLARRGPRTDAYSGLHTGYLVATALIATAALLLITVAFTMSYAALYESATWLEDTQLTAINGGDLRFLFPLGIDAVIVYFLAMDLVMEWQGRRHPLNRWSAYGLSAITIVLNVSQGEGTTSSYLGHAGPPVVIILIAEGVAAWVRHLAGLAHGKAADRIPAGRWIAHPLSTLKVARLMLGSGITSYPDALEREQQRQLAYAMLREQYARRWRRATPRHLKWMLDNGYDLPTAFRIIRAMTASRVAMTAEEARALLGEPAGVPAAPAEGRARWRAVAAAEQAGAVNGASANGAAPSAPTVGGGADDAASRPAAGADAGRAAAADQSERAYTPVFQAAPGPSAGPDGAPEDAPGGRASAHNGREADTAAQQPTASSAGPGSEQPEEGGRAPAADAPAAPGGDGPAGLRFTPEPAAEPERQPEPADGTGPAPPYEEPSRESAPRRSTSPLSRPSAQERKQQVRNLMETVPDITEDEIAGYLGVSARTVRKYRHEILATAANDGYRVEEGEDGQPRLVHSGYGD
ncbi:DUF2637 domain-containing protein [Streptomonospora wellingtoniae]|uniref:DUF2637 domain-containing protein n=1 Tax=Streptomonospora wellingtoniae TaxID=3075544 RepID=A0ABU2KS27_9ACTN|nr:DUF2637 domain-containing protein [Streptomonospora sp. DSM 45055]MDT0301913.1 DUF2637 domain-containing protein [Streptomonospora sp. DSM 45055]